MAQGRRAGHQRGRRSEGRHRARACGLAKDDRDPPLMRMYLARSPARRSRCCSANRKGYTGNDACAVCHEAGGTRPGQFTKHARAFDTLVTHGEEREAGVRLLPRRRLRSAGWLLVRRSRAPTSRTWAARTATAAAAPTSRPTSSKRWRAAQAYARRCARAATTRSTRSGSTTRASCRRSRTRRSRRCTAEERVASSRRGRTARATCCPRRRATSDPRPARAATQAEFETWCKSGARPRAGAPSSLKEARPATRLPCLPHDRLRPRPAASRRSGDASDHPDLGRVGCESCHGPGGDTSSKEAREALGTHRQPRRQVRLLRDPADLRKLPRRGQRPRLRVPGARSTSSASATARSSPAPASPSARPPDVWVPRAASRLQVAEASRSSTPARASRRGRTPMRGEAIARSFQRPRPARGAGRRGVDSASSAWPFRVVRRQAAAADGRRSRRSARCPAAPATESASEPMSGRCAGD